MLWRVRTKYLIPILFLAVSSNGLGQLLEFPPAVPLELHRPPDDETRRMQRSAAQLENRGEYQKALELYLELFDRLPEYNAYYDGVIRSFLAVSKYEAGLNWVDSLQNVILQNVRPVDLTAIERERFGNYIVDGGRFCAKLGDRETALQRWAELYKVPNISSTPFYRLFNAMIAARYPEGLEDMVRKARSVTRDPSLLATSLAGFYANQGRVDRAVEEWLHLMELKPRQTEHIKRQILNLPEDEHTQSQLESSLKAGLSNSAIRLNVVELLGSIYFRSREWEKAYKQVKEADKIGGDSGLAMLTFAERLISEGENDLALNVLNDLKESHVELSMSARGWLARARNLEAMNAYQNADSIYSILISGQYIKTAQGQEALILQAKMRLHKLKDPRAAREILEEALRRVPRLRSPGEIKLLIGDTYLVQKDLEAAGRIYMEVATGRYGRQPALQAHAMVNAAQVEFFNGKIERAKELLKDASQRSPDGILTNDALDMLELLRSAKDDSMGIAIFAKAELELQIGNSVEAESLYVILIERRGKGDLYERALLKTAALKRQSGRINDAIETLTNFLNQYPQSLRIPAILLDLGEIHDDLLSDPQKAGEYYERILIDYPESLQTDEARKRLRELELPET